MQTEMGHDLIFAPTGEQQGRIGNHPVRTVQLMSGGQPVTALGPQNQVEISPVPFAPETQRAARTDGYWIGRQNGPEIALLDATGKVRTLVRWLGKPVATTKTDMQGYVDQAIEAATSEEQRAALRTQGTAYFQYAATLPPHGPLVAGVDGALWMNEYRRPGVRGPERWTVFGPDGVAREEVELPEGSTLL